jgi:hypothetical protein
MMYEIIMRLATIDSVATDEALRANLTNLPIYAASVNGDIDLINSYFDVNYSQLLARGSTIDDPIAKLFDAYLVIPDYNFKQYIAKKQDDYHDGNLGANFMHESLMAQATAKFTYLTTRKIWGSKSPDKEHLIAMIADLKGKKISTTTGTTAHVFLDNALRANNLDPAKDVEIVNQRMAEAVTAFISGAVPAVALWVPFDITVKQRVPGAVKLVDASAYFPQAAIVGGWAARNDWFDRNRDACQRRHLHAHRNFFRRAQHEHGTAGLRPSKLGRQLRVGHRHGYNFQQLDVGTQIDHRTCADLLVYHHLPNLRIQRHRIPQRWSGQLAHRRPEDQRLDRIGIYAFAGHHRIRSRHGHRAGILHLPNSGQQQPDFLRR